MKYKGKHRPGGGGRRDRYQRAGAGCLPAAVLLSNLIAERGARGTAPVAAEPTTVVPAARYAMLVRPYVRLAAR